MPVHPGPVWRWPRPARWFSLGRSAVANLARLRFKAALWIPDYFCADVASAWACSIRLSSYVDDPWRSQPDWSTLKPRSGDAVLAVNYFGARCGDMWKQWRESHNGCVLVEDHTHDPFSEWAKTSEADYAFASLRKTMPIPDGAILWSPRRLPLPPPPVERQTLGAAEKLSGMVYKQHYLSEGQPFRFKQLYRELLGEGERNLQTASATAPSAYAARYLEYGYPVAWRTQRRRNTQALCAELQGWSLAQPLAPKWPSDAAPFGYALLFEDHAARRRCRAYLEKHRIYCPVHWPQNRSSTRRARGLASRSLTIPVDHRYGRDDMVEIGRVLTRFR